MQELKGITGTFYAVSEWVLRMSSVNLIWFILCLPLFAALVLPDMATVAGPALFATGVLLFLPLLAFPATAAVFSAAREWVTDPAGASAVRTFIASLKTDYKENVKAGMLFAGLWLVWYYGFFTARPYSLAVLALIAAGAALLVFTAVFFAVSAHYRMQFRARLKNALFISAGSPLLGLTVVAISGLSVWASVALLPLLLPLLACSFSAFVIFSVFYRFVRKVEQKAETDRNGYGGMRHDDNP